MADANRAQKTEDSAFEDDPFLDAAEVERRLLGEASLDDGFGEAFGEAYGGEFGDEPHDAGFDDSFAREPDTAQAARPFGAAAVDAASETVDDPFADDPFFAEAAIDAPNPVHEAMDGLRSQFSPEPAGNSAEYAAEAPAEDEFSSDFNPEYDGDPLEETLLSDALYGEVDFEAPTQPIPRITIAAFCERSETSVLMETTGGDRRLAKAHLEVHMGGLPAAIERYHDTSTPNLLIVETGMRGRNLFNQLEELAGVCDPDTKVVIVGAANDIMLYRELIKRGVSEYLVPPMTPLHIIKTISDLFLDPEAPFAGKTIAFIGAKGGVGSSTVAHNTAWCVAEDMETDSVLVDMDLSFGTAGLDFNQDPAQTLGDALAEPDRLDDALLDRLLVRCTDRLSLFSAPATLDRDWEFSPVQYEMVLEKVRRQAPFIMLDLPHMWTPWVRQTLLSSDEVVVTVSPDLASLRNAKNMVDLITTARPNDEPPKIVVNMAGTPKRPEIPLKEFAEALGAQPVLVLPFEPQLFGKAANNGQMIREIDAKTKAADGFDYLARAVSGREIGSKRKRGLFGGIFGG